VAYADSSGGSLSASEVLAFAARVARSGSTAWNYLCQKFVRMAYGSSGGAATATEAWRNARYKHTRGEPRPGAIMYWGGGAGHAAIYAGNGMVYTTDPPGGQAGSVALVPLKSIQAWGKPFLGWTEDTNGIRVNKWDAQPVDGVGMKYAPVAEGNVTTQGGGYATGYSKKELRERYGYVAQMYESVPEIQRLVKQAIRAGWTEDEFDRRLQASKWYRKHTEEERQWVVLAATQPGEAKQQVQQRKADIINQYRRMGVPIAAKRVQALAENSVKHGWTEQQLTNAIAAEFDYKGDQTYGGVAGQTVDDLRQMASAYLVPIGNKRIDQWTTNVLRGEASPEDFESYLKEQAKSLWDDPQLHAALDRGVTTDQYLDPYRQMAAQELEMNPDDINWLGNPKWSQAIFRANDKGERRFLSLADWQRTLRTDPTYGFDKTSTARDTAAQFTTELASMFGRRG
jgi:cell wall-associated NlpC family hydrolase